MTHHPDAVPFESALLYADLQSLGTLGVGLDSLESAWIPLEFDLDFLGFSRPNRAFSMGYADPRLDFLPPAASPRVVAATRVRRS